MKRNIVVFVIAALLLLFAVGYAVYSTASGMAQGTGAAQLVSF